jgi:hypothetical protein
MEGNMVTRQKRKVMPDENEVLVLCAGSYNYTLMDFEEADELV